MTRREVVKIVLDGGRPPYVPWHCDFTVEAGARLAERLGTADLDEAIGNHILELGDPIGYVEPLGNQRFRDPFGVVWNRTVDKDIGVVEGVVLAEPSLAGYRFPDPTASFYFDGVAERIAARPGRFRVYCIGFSLFERAWTLRGLENLLVDFVENPGFVDDLFDAICDFNIAMAGKALEYGIDAIYFGDDWGKQSGLIMGPRHWRRYLRPRLERMYAVAKGAGKYQCIHSCGDVRQVLPDLVELGVDCINPFQPEAMPVREVLGAYRGRVAFYGGLSTQHTLPFGDVQEVRRKTRELLELGAGGGLIFAPSHAVVRDTPVENMLAFLEELQAQSRPV
jgi:uroporphyrinogen decarboxylase